MVRVVRGRWWSGAERCRRERWRGAGVEVRGEESGAVEDRRERVGRRSEIEEREWSDGRSKIEEREWSGGRRSKRERVERRSKRERVEVLLKVEGKAPGMVPAKRRVPGRWPSAVPIVMSECQTRKKMV